MGFTNRQCPFKCFLGSEDGQVVCKDVCFEVERERERERFGGGVLRLVARISSFLRAVDIHMKNSVHHLNAFGSLMQQQRLTGSLASSAPGGRAETNNSLATSLLLSLPLASARNSTISFTLLAAPPHLPPLKRYLISNPLTPLSTPSLPSFPRRNGSTPLIPVFSLQISL